MTCSNPCSYSYVQSRKPAVTGRSNGTRCKDGVKVLWQQSHLVWLLFEGSIPTCACFHTENVFVTCQIFIHLPSKYESSAPQEEMFSDQPMKGHMPCQVADDT